MSLRQVIGALGLLLALVAETTGCSSSLEPNFEVFEEGVLMAADDSGIMVGRRDFIVYTPERVEVERFAGAGGDSFVMTMSGWMHWLGDRTETATTLFRRGPDGVTETWRNRLVASIADDGDDGVVWVEESPSMTSPVLWQWRAGERPTLIAPLSVVPRMVATADAVFAYDGNTIVRISRTDGASTNLASDVCAMAAPTGGVLPFRTCSDEFLLESIDLVSFERNALGHFEMEHPGCGVLPSRVMPGVSITPTHIFIGTFRIDRISGVGERVLPMRCPTVVIPENEPPDATLAGPPMVSGEYVYWTWHRYHPDLPGGLREVVGRLPVDGSPIPN